MKKVVSIVLVFALAFSMAALSGCGSSDQVTLNVYNWGVNIADGTDEYIDVIALFEEKYTNIDVNYTTYEDNESLYTRLKNGGVSYDVIIPSDYMIARMIDEDMLLPLNFDNIPNYELVDDTFKNQAYDPNNEYSVPYTWGTVGILYNDKLVEELGAKPPESWLDLWDEKFAGEILMQDSVRDAFMCALKPLGYSLNSTNPEELRQARDLLIAQKPLVQAYVIDQVRDKMLGGEAAVGVIYSGEMLYLQELAEGKDFQLEYVIPKEGTNLWIDSWVITKTARNKENAEKWIDFLCRPDIAKRNFEYITYATPNRGAFELLDPELQQNKAVFPDWDSLQDAEVYQYLGDEVDSLYNELWKEVKSN